jgi:hypothetical protein
VSQGFGSLCSHQRADDPGRDNRYRSGIPQDQEKNMVAIWLRTIPISSGLLNLPSRRVVFDAMANRSN